MNRNKSYFSGAAAAILCTILVLSGCSLLTGPNGEAGAAGKDGAMLYVRIKSVDASSSGTDPVGTLVYSGGEIYLGSVVNTTFSIVNKTGHAITLLRAGTTYIQNGLIYSEGSADVPAATYANDESGLNPVIEDSAATGNDFVITVSNITLLAGRCCQRFYFQYRDNSTGETGIFAFTVKYLGGMV